METDLAAEADQLWRRLLCEQAELAYQIQLAAACKDVRQNSVHEECEKSASDLVQEKDKTGFAAKTSGILAQDTECAHLDDTCVCMSQNEEKADISVVDESFQTEQCFSGTTPSLADMKSDTESQNSSYSDALSLELAAEKGQRKAAEQEATILKGMNRQLNDQLQREMTYRMHLEGNIAEIKDEEEAKDTHSSATQTAVAEVAGTSQQACIDATPSLTSNTHTLMSPSEVCDIKVSSTLNISQVQSLIELGQPEGDEGLTPYNYIPKPIHSISVQTDQTTLVSAHAQTTLSLPLRSSEPCSGPEGLSTKLVSEQSQRVAAEQLAELLQAENAQLMARLQDELQNRVKLENTMAELRSSSTYDRRMYEEYKYQVEKLEADLINKSQQVMDLEKKLEEASEIKSGIDFMLDARYAETKAAQTEAQLKAMEQERDYYKAETSSLKDQLSQAIQERREMISMDMHFKLLQVSDERAKMAEQSGRQLYQQVDDLKQEILALTKKLQRKEAINPSVPPSKDNTFLVDLPEVTNLHTDLPPAQHQSKMHPDTDDWSSSSEDETDTPERQGSMSVSNIPKSPSKGSPPKGQQPLRPAGLHPGGKPAIAKKPKLAPKPTQRLPNPSRLPPKPSLLPPKPSLPQPTGTAFEEALVPHEAAVSFTQDAQPPSVVVSRRVQGPQGRRKPSRFNVAQVTLDDSVT